MKFTRECITPADEARFWSKVDRQEGPSRPGELGPCWPWLAALYGSGYGEFLVDGRLEGAHRVAFVLGDGEVAIEVKGTSRVDQRDLASIRSFAADYRPKKSLVVCNEKEERVVGPLRIMPWRKFLEDLWSGRIIT